MDSEDKNKVTIKFSRNIEDFKEGVFWGLDLKQFLIILSCVVILVGAWCFFNYIVKLDSPLTMYFGLIFCIPLMMRLPKKNGLTYSERSKKKKDIKRMGNLLWSSSEKSEIFEKIAEEGEKEKMKKESRKDNELSFEETVRKAKRMILIAAIVGVVIVIAAIIAKIIM